MKFIEKGTKTFRQANLMLFFGGFVTFAILYCTQPLMPVFSKEFNITPAVASLSLSVTTATLAISMLVAASLSEALGRKNVMTVSMVLSSVLIILTAFCSNFHMLLIFRLIQGIVLAGIPAIAMAYVNEEFHPASLGLAMGLYISGNSIGGLSGRMITGVVTDLSSWRVAMLVIGVISLILGFLFWRNLPDSKHFTPQEFNAKHLVHTLVGHLKDPALLMLFSLGFFLMGSFVTLYNYIGYHLMEPPYNLSQTVISFLFIVYVVGTFSSAWAGKLADKIGLQKVLVISISIMLAGALITLFTPLLIKFLGLAIFTYGFFASHSIASSWVGRRSEKEKAQASSLYLFFYYFGSSISGFIGGIFWHRMGWSGVIGLISSFLVVGVIVSLALKKMERKPSHQINMEKITHNY